MNQAKDIAYKMPFVKQDTREICYSGMPRLDWNIFKQASRAIDFVNFVRHMEQQEITLHDARGLDIDYKNQGFTLAEQRSAVTDFSTDDQKTIYVEELKTLLQEYHPHAKKIEITEFLFRGDSQNNPPATNGPHLDFYQDLDQVQHFGNKLDLSTAEKEGLKLESIIGIWKPINMSSPVYDLPLCILDGSTFKEEHQVRFEVKMMVDIKGVNKEICGLASNLNFDQNQRWYYYPEMTTDEVILFHQLSKDRFFANIHCAFRNPNLPDQFEPRQSIETRALIWV